MKRTLKIFSLILAIVTICCAFFGCDINYKPSGEDDDPPQPHEDPKGAITQPYDREAEESKMPSITKQYKTVEGKKYEFQNGKIQLVQDQSFQTGVNVLGYSPDSDGRTVKARLDYNGQALDNSEIDPWEYTQWYVNPGIHQEAQHVVKGDYDIYSNDVKVVRINRHKQEIYLSINSKDLVVDSYWPHALIEKSFTYTPKFGDMKSLKASMKFCLEDYKNWNGKEQGGQAAQMSWWFFISDRQNKLIDDGRDCFFGIPLFDSRPDMGGISQGEIGQSFGWENNTKDALFKVARYNTQYVTIKDSNGNVALNSSSSRLETGKEYTIEVDMLGAFELGLQQLKNYSNSDKTIQNEVRSLFAGGVRDNFFITGFNIGWEMPYGKYNAGFRFSEISLLAEMK